MQYPEKPINEEIWIPYRKSVVRFSLPRNVSPYFGDKPNSICITCLVYEYDRPYGGGHIYKLLGAE